MEQVQELYNERAEREAAWCDQCGAYHDWKLSCEEAEEQWQRRRAKLPAKVQFGVESYRNSMKRNRLKAGQ